MDKNQLSVFQKIIANKHLLSKKENEVAEFVLESPEYVISNTITDIARKINVSESGVNRFCKKIGYKGFNDFKMDLVRISTVNNMKTNILANRDISYVDSVTMSYQNTLMNTASMLTESALKITVDAITNARRVIILGTNVTKTAVTELLTNLTMLGVQVNAYTNMDDIKIIAPSIREGDLIFMIAPNLFSTDIYDFIIKMSDENVSMVGLTTYDSPQLNEYLIAKHVTFDHSYLKTSKVLSQNIAFIFVCDVIIGMMVDSNPEFKKLRIKSESSLTKDSFLYDAYLNL